MVVTVLFVHLMLITCGIRCALFVFIKATNNLLCPFVYGFPRLRFSRWQQWQRSAFKNQDSLTLWRRSDISPGRFRKLKSSMLLVPASLSLPQFSYHLVSF